MNTKQLWNALCLNPITNKYFDGVYSVTNYYLVGKLSTSLNLSSYLVSSWSKSLSISGGDSSCSWVLVPALGLIVKEEFKSVMLGGGWRCGELLIELQYLCSNSENSQVSASAKAPALEEYKYSASVQSLLLLLGLVMISEHRINR